MKNKTILIIEDSPEMRENTAEILSLGPYDIVVAKDGKEGIDMIIKNHPDLIICDVIMPEMDGFDVLRSIGDMIKKDHIPFIFLTARSEKSDVQTGIELGASDYLVKPFRGDELLRIVNMKLCA